MFGLTVDSFTGFEARDFDAFAPAKWSSHRFNLERMRAADLVKVLGQSAQRELARAGLELHGEASAPHPSIFNQHRVEEVRYDLCRLPEARRELSAMLARQGSLAEDVRDPDPTREHVALFVRLFHDGLEVGVRLHHAARVDARTLVARLSEPWSRQTFAARLATLRSGALCRWPTGAETPVAGFTADDAARLASELTEGRGEWVLAWRYPRTDPQLAEAAFEQRLVADLQVLAPLWVFAAWSRDNDPGGLAGELKRERLERRRPPAAATLAPGVKVRVTGGLLAGLIGEVLALEGGSHARIRIEKRTLRVELQHLNPL